MTHDEALQFVMTHTLPMTVEELAQYKEALAVLSGFKLCDVCEE